MRYLALCLLLLLAVAQAADSDLAGKYAGEWKSGPGGTGGAFRMTLEAGANGAWKWEVTFAYAGQDIKTTPGALKVEQGKLEGWYDFELQGFTLRSKLTGTWNGKAFEGKYQSGAPDGSSTVDEGTWSVTRAR